MKCLKCGGMQMLRCEYNGGGIYWFCPRCHSTTESTSESVIDVIKEDIEAGNSPFDDKYEQKKNIKNEVEK